MISLDQLWWIGIGLWGIGMLFAFLSGGNTYVYQVAVLIEGVGIGVEIGAACVSLGWAA